MKYLVALICIIAIPALGQYHVIREDTITSGNANEYHPALSRGIDGTGYTWPTDWLVFDRQTDDSSFIVAKKTSLFSLIHWDSSEVIISRASQAENLSCPEIGWDGTYGLIAWQKRIGAKTNIFYSTYSQTTQSWSEAHQLTNDTLDNVNVRVGQFSGDSRFVIAWRNRNIFRLRLVPDGVANANDTVAISNDDSAAFDLQGALGVYRNGFLYTTTSGDSTNIILADFTTIPVFSVTVRDTITTSMSVFHARFVESRHPSVDFIIEASESHDKPHRIFGGRNNPYYPPGLIEITETDSGSMYRNPRSFDFPLMTGNSVVKRTMSSGHVVAAECYKTTDSTERSWIVILQGDHRDSISSIGYNRNPVIGANQFYSRAGNSFPLVWESNRSGKNHLYGFRYVSYYSLGVDEKKYFSPDFTLMQNYPNPFNPSTTIGYGLARASHVTLKVFNVLGEEVATLLNETQSAGVHQCQFSSEAKGLSSGVYFYRLQAGEFAQTRSMIVLK